MKKDISLIAAVLMCCFIFVGCTGDTSTQTSESKTISDFDATSFVNNEYMGMTIQELEEMEFLQSEDIYVKVVDTPFSKETYLVCQLSTFEVVDSVGYVWYNNSIDKAVDQSLEIKKTIDAQADEIVSTSQENRETTFEKNDLLHSLQDSSSSIICLWSIENEADLGYSIHKEEDGQIQCILLTDRSVNTDTEDSYSTIIYDTQLGSGHYISGIDFPAGTYSLTAVKGGGNVSSDNMYNGGINAIMGVKDDDFYQKEYSNISLPYGTRLSIDGVTLNIHSDNASGAPLSKREQHNTEEVTLGNGNFIAGVNFPAGIYDIVAISGSGNVYTNNMYDGGLNAVMGVKNSDFYINEYKNVSLASGVTLTVDGVKIKLIPSN